MAALQLGVPLALKTSSIGWPVELNIYKIRDDVYFDVTVTLEYLGLLKHVKKHGFSFIDKFLSENGECPSLLHKLLKWFQNEFRMNGSFKLELY